MATNEQPVQQNTPNVVRLEYTGERFGATTYNANGRSYRAGANPFDRYVDCPPEDAAVLEAQGVFRRVYQPPTQAQAAPPPTQAVVTPPPELTEAQKSQAAQNAMMKARKEFDQIWAEDEKRATPVTTKVVASREDIPAQEPAPKPAPKTSGRQKKG